MIKEEITCLSSFRDANDCDDIYSDETAATDPQNDELSNGISWSLFKFELYDYIVNKKKVSFEGLMD